MQVEGIRDDHTVLDTTVVNANGNFYQRSIDWHVPLVLKQFTVLITFEIGDCTRIGNLYFTLQRLGYRLQYPPPTGNPP